MSGRISPSYNAGLSGLRLLRSRFGRLDLSSTLVGITLLAAMFVLWSGLQRSRALSAAVSTLRSALMDTLPKPGDALTPALRAQGPGGQEVALLSADRSSLWIFFSTHCHICMGESGSWQGLASQMKASGVSVNFLSLDRAVDTSEFSHFHEGLPVSTAPKDLLRSLRLTAVPCYVLLGPDGVIKWTHQGALSRSDLAALRGQVESHRSSGANPSD